MFRTIEKISLQEALQETILLGLMGSFALFNALPLSARDGVIVPVNFPAWSAALAFVFWVLWLAYLFFPAVRAWREHLIWGCGTLFSLYLGTSLVVNGFDYELIRIFWINLFFVCIYFSQRSLLATYLIVNYLVINSVHFWVEDLPFSRSTTLVRAAILMGITYYFIKSIITLRKRAIENEQILRIKNQEVEAILNSVRAPIAYKDAANRIIKINQALAERMMTTREEATGVSLYDLLPPDMAKKYHDEDLDIIRSGQPKHDIVEHVIMPDHKTWRWYRSNKTPIFDENGVVMGIVIHSEDITTEMEALKKLEAGEQRLRAYANRLEESNQNLQEFAYVISHDLREPLRTITAYTQLLRRYLKPENLSTDVQEFMHFIVDATKRMDGQINGILEYSRVGRAALDIERIMLQKVVETAQANLYQLFVETQATLEIKSPLPEVRADKLQLTLLMQNLLSNALKYRKPELPPCIQIEAEPEGKGWKIAVRDNGIGIEPQYLDTIFGVFRRLHTRTDIEGSGIGLSICRRIVQRHGGRIWAESVFGEGTVFYFTLPENE